MSTPSSNHLRKLAQYQRVYVLDRYDPTYTFLNETWIRICNANFKTTPKELVLLETLVFQDKVPQDAVEELVKACDALTEEGYCIRDLSKFQPCVKKCGTAIVTKELYTHARHKWLFLPLQWTPLCSTCQDA